jgi:hypothetical protein
MTDDRGRCWRPRLSVAIFWPTRLGRAGRSTSIFATHRSIADPAEREDDAMVMLILLAVPLIGMMCMLAYRLATFALPCLLGFTAARFAYTTGAGLIGAGLVGSAAGMAAFGILALLFHSLRSPVLRFLIMIAFVGPAALAGYQLVHGIAREAVPSVIWRQIFFIIGGIAVGVSAWLRLAMPVDLEQKRRS